MRDKLLADREFGMGLIQNQVQERVPIVIIEVR